MIGTAIFVDRASRRCSSTSSSRRRARKEPHDHRLDRLSHEELQQAARDHLWLHFTRMGGYRDAEVPIIVRGDGCYLEDANGKRYLDALAGLFAVQIGYSYGEEIGAGGARADARAALLHELVVRAPARDRARAEVASLAPGDLNRVFFVSGGSEAVESAWKLARQYHAARGERRWKAIARRTAYHGTTMGALSINGIAGAAHAVRAARARRRCTSATRTATTGPPDETEEEFTRVPARRPRADDRRRRARRRSRW